jgi:hypothetical protein
MRLQPPDVERPLRANTHLGSLCLNTNLITKNFRFTLRACARKFLDEPQRRDILVTASSSGTEDRGFESSQGARF